MKDVIIPPLGENITKATVSYWYVKVGDKVKEKDDLVEVATDKATFNVPSPCSGVIAEIVVAEGDTAAVGAVVARIKEAL
jgi:pyruvate/2-oxoglutarate dehydrogenase complex dihydrolipoamide acyltransferase (E2) component